MNIRLIPFIPLFFTLMPIVALLNGLSAVALLAALGIWLLYDTKGWRLLPRLPRRYLYAVGAMALWPLASSLWAISPEVAVKTVVRTALMIAIALFLAELIRAKASVMPGIGQGYAWGITAAVCLLWSEFLPTGGIISAGATLLQADAQLYFHKDIKRGLCALAVLLWPALAMLEAQGRRRLALCLPPAALAGMMAMHGLSAIMACFAGTLVFYLLLCIPRKGPAGLVYGVLLLLALWPWLFQAGEPWVRERWYGHLPESFRHRMEIWHFALDTWRQQPWTGWGADNSRFIPGGLTEIRPGWALMPMHPHNMPFQLLLELGIIGYFLLLAGAWLVLTHIFRVRREPSYSALGWASRGATVTAYLVIGGSSFNMWQSWWVATGLIAFLLHVMAAYVRPALRETS